MPILLVAFNMLLFGTLAWLAIRSARRSPYRGTRQLWILAALPMVAVVLGGTLRLGLQALRLGVIPEDSLDALLGTWQSIQSVLVAALGIATFIGVRRLAERFTKVEAVIGEMVDRVQGVDMDDLALTVRERDVLDLIASRPVIDDRTLAEELGVSSDTMHTHVTSLMRKTGLRSRRDLQAVAFLWKTPPN